mmetsp:Transcript_13820/g.28148  ORF Transcript_13820/g.28148 Transcript_13820/m.28148 type:complete len:575 (+) Transcript_13820:103-1827(+)
MAMITYAMKVVAALSLGMHYLIATDVASSSAAATPRQLTPTLHAQELFHNADITWWNLELQAASQAVVDRRRHRNRRKLRQQHRRTQSNSNCLSPLQRWFVSLIESIGLDTWEELNYYNVTSLTYLYKHHVSSSSGQNEYFGIYGEDSKQMKSNHESLKLFWTLGNNNGMSTVGENNAASPTNVVLLGMHGNDLSAKGKLVPTLQQLYGLDAPTALTLADKIQSIIEKLPDAYNNPVLTANALAIQSPHSDGSNSERDSIIIGDGVFAFLKWLQLDNGPDYIHSHEFGHHLQYDLGIMKKNGMGLSQAEETRRLELMSDMFGSYYLAHKSGGGLDTKQLDEVHRAAFSMGDCKSSIATHHGSPRQRECASNYGANLAIKFGGKVLPPVKLKNMFDAKLSEILALTADECRGGLDDGVFENTFYGQDNSGNSAISSSSSGGGNWWESKLLPVEDVQDLNIPTMGVPPPSADVEYASWGSSFESGSGDKTWGLDAGWDGYNFEWYSQEVEENNSVGKPSEKIQNDGLYSSKYEDGNSDWFGSSQWAVGVRITNSGSTTKIGVSFGVCLICLLGTIF